MPDNRAQVGLQRRWIIGRVGVNRRLKIRHPAEIRHVILERDFLAEILVSGVLRHADDFERRRLAPVPDQASERIRCPEKPPGHRLADDDFGRIGIIDGGQLTAAEQWDAQRLEETRAHDDRGHLHSFIGLRRVAIDREPRAHDVAAQESGSRKRRTAHSGQGRDPATG